MYNGTKTWVSIVHAKYSIYVIGKMKIKTILFCIEVALCSRNSEQQFEKILDSLKCDLHFLA